MTIANTLKLETMVTGLHQHNTTSESLVTNINFLLEHFPCNFDEFWSFWHIVIMIELEYILTHQLIHMQRPGNDFYLGSPTNVKNCQQLVCISYLVIPLIPLVVRLSKKICSRFSVLWEDLLCFQIPPFCHKYIHLKIQNNFSTIFSLIFFLWNKNCHFGKCEMSYFYENKHFFFLIRLCLHVEIQILSNNLM